VEAELAAAIEDILRRGRPFLIDEIVDLGSEQPGAEILPQIRCRLRGAEQAVDPRAIGAGQATQQGRRKAGVCGEGKNLQERPNMTHLNI